MKNYLQLVSGSSWTRQHLTCSLDRLTFNFQIIITSIGLRRQYTSINISTVKLV
jgi:hypothetical protein